MQSPTTQTCQYCAKRPADQTLFTTFMCCGEGDATKRNAHLCDRCCHHAILVLDHVGMTVAFEGDGQLRWDAHVMLSKHAARSLARRAMQRHDLLVQLRDTSAASRAPAAAQPEKLSILHQLAAEGLVENTIDRSEFWPDDTCRLTAKGQEAALFIHERRRAEAHGLPIGEWSPLYVPEQGTEDEFREYADQHVISPEGDCYDSTPHLMLRRNSGEPAEGQDKPRQTHLFFEEDIWTTRPAEPVGYFFFENLPAIAFDIDDVQMLAEYYEVIRGVTGPDVRWTVMDPTPANPVYLEGTGARTIRADGPATRAAAFVSIFRPPGERPGIQTLRKRTRTRRPGAHHNKNRGSSNDSRHHAPSPAPQPRITASTHRS